MEKLIISRNSKLSLYDECVLPLRREEQRLKVRQAATLRILRQAKILLASQAALVSNEDEEDDDLIAGIEALQYDLNTYVAQFQDRIRHVEQGIKSLVQCDVSCEQTMFVEYIKEDTHLCLRDTKVALEGYDELIQNLQTISRQADSDQ